MRIGRPGFFLAVLALAVAALPALPASAAAPGDEFKWSVVPSSRSGPSGRSRFEYTLKPREEIADWVAVSNLGKKPLKVDIYATDALNAPDGGFALMLANQQPKGVGSWVALQVKQYTVPVGKRVDIPFRLKVPANAEPGDHIGGIIASATEATTNAEGQQVNVERRVAARVYLRVDGPLQPVAQITAVDVQYDNPLQPFGGRDMTVTYRVANLGNVRFSGTSRVVVKGPLGVRVANSELIDIPELLPDSEVRLTRKVSGVFPAGRLSAEVIVNPTAQSGALESLSESRSLWALPWLVIAVLLAALAVPLLVWWRRRRARRLAAQPGFDDLPAAVPAARGVALVVVALAALGGPAALEPSPAQIDIQVSIAPSSTPVTPTPTPAPSPTDGGGGGGDLPRTGLAFGAIIVAGVALLGGGAGLRVLGRR
ncbi:WxL protein peptidoglycan domain-containing protein [Phytohabitans rumicis]|uniref:WxL protein peptidoglycan domain-containing protein n=1 Tax=Phytohabitans rumicis TaxID=1076125 RepID=UPI0031EBE0B7